MYAVILKEKLMESFTRHDTPVLYLKMIFSVFWMTLQRIKYVLDYQKKKDIWKWDQRC